MQKQRKFNPKQKPKAPKTTAKGKGPKRLTDAKWKSVKLSGPVISDEGGNFDGLIGLEILESYDRKLVLKEKPKISDRDYVLKDDNGPTVSRKKRPPSDSEDQSSDEEVKPQRKKVKQQQKKGKEPQNSSKVASIDSDAELDEQPVKKKTKPAKKEKEAAQPGKGVEGKSPSSDRKKKKIKPTKEKNVFSSLEYSKWVEMGVSEPIVRALAEKGFQCPTEIQTLSLPVAIFGHRDLLGAAETGSGKTLAFGIPLLEGIMKRKQELSDVSGDPLHDESSEHELTPPPEEIEFFPAMNDEDNDDGSEQEEWREYTRNIKSKTDMGKPLYGLILTPTRELAVQINDHLKAVAKYTDIKIALVFGGLAAVKQERLLSKCPEIVIATPGRLWELIQSGNPHLSKVDQIRYLVIDETDRMLEKGHFEELKQLLDRINADEDAKNRRRNYIFSATLTMDHDMPDRLKAKTKKKKSKVTQEAVGQRLQNLIDVIGMTEPKVVDITKQHGTAHTLTESRILCKPEHKDYYLYYFLQRHPGRTLVFCNSIDCVRRLVSLFNYLACQPHSLFGSMQQRQRLKNLEKFTHDANSLLIATDVAARGLDIPNVDHVIHYQVPKTTENYVHRSGRTARASKEGITVLMISAGEVKDYVKLNKNLGRTEDLPMYPTSERMMRQIKERVNMARSIERLDLKQRRSGAERGWEDKVAREYQTDSDIDSEQEEMRKLEKSKEKRFSKAQRFQLSRLLATPIVMDRMDMRYPTSGDIVNKAKEQEKSAITLVKQMVENEAQRKNQKKKKKQQVTM